MDIEEAHDLSCQKGQKLFKHPGTGLMVMNRNYLKEKGKCCGNKCLFCPYGHAKVKNHKCSPETCPHATKDDSLAVAPVVENW